MFHELLYLALGLVLLAYTVDFYFNLGDDPREPSRVRSRVPLIGHVLGLMRNGPSYYAKTSAAANSEIYTLGVLNFKVYISASSRLLPFIQKQSKALSFRPFLQLVARRYGDASDTAYKIFGGSLPDDMSQSIKSSLAPGPHLDELSLRMGKRVLTDIDILLDVDQGAKRKVQLLAWARHAVVQATSCAVYGEKHPFIDPEIEKSYWTWMTYLTAHLVGWLDVTGTGYAVREKVFAAYINYCKNLPEQSSHLMKDHQRVLGEAGIPDKDRAKQAAIFTIASFSNSAPTLYWTLWELFSRPDTLAEVRSELEEHAVTGSKDTGFVLDVSALKSKCPVLLSVFQETQRTRHVNPSFRKVLVDTVLDKYLLKAGTFLQVPGGVIHSETDIWGPTALEFDPHRFVPKNGEKGSGPTASGFVPWGAAPYLCPARQFAATEILIITALLAMRAEVAPAAGGNWERHPALEHADLATLSPPKKDIDMHIGVREEWAGKWNVKMVGSRGSSIRLASG